MAKNVEVYTQEICDKNEKRANFLPCPFEWTHAIGNTERVVTRDINPNQSVYLDLFRYSIGWAKGQGGKNRLWLNLPGIDIEDYAIIKQGISTLRINLFQSNGQTIKMRIRIIWEDYEKEPIFKIISKYDYLYERIKFFLTRKNTI